jgi:subfamily B ATP-binding cassette protein MsbA
MVALVGESGGGKSTLTKLLPRFHDPVAGTVLWDGIDLRDAKLSSLRKQIGLVTQETILFNDTVRYNITYGQPEATEQQIEEAARIAFAHEFIIDLPEVTTRSSVTRDLSLRRATSTAGHRPRDPG